MNTVRGAEVRGINRVESTLRVERRFGQTILLSLLLLVVMLGTGELVARSRMFKQRLIATDWGSSHQQFELQMGRLETILAINGSVDCIFLGNSMVWRGFEPQVFARVYHEESGRELRCFNFGVDGIPASGAGMVAPILVQDFEPQYLIYGTDARDYAVPAHAQDAAVLLDMPWLRYRHGQFSLRGWFYEHMHFLRYWESLGNLMRLQKTYLFLRKTYDVGAEHYGFTGDDTVGDYVGSSPLQHLELGSVRYYLDLLSDYKVLPENVNGLREIASLNGSQTQVIIVEMPVPETYLEFLGNGEQDYDRFLSEVENIAYNNQIPFLRTQALELIPDDGWVDYSHLNTKGARIFSHWFATQMTARVIEASKR